MVDASAPTGWLVGAYAASPSRIGWDAGAERTYLDAVRAMPGVVGLEIPWTGAGLHLHDEPWLLAWLPADAQIVVTTAPETSARLRASAAFGLASTDADGRHAAVDAANALRDGVHRLRDALPDGRVVAVELHTAPLATPGASSADALHASLSELAARDWAGATLVVEHCDAWSPDRAPAKGHMRLEDEIAVAADLRRAGLPVGVSINWGRSVIEARDPDGATRHVALAADAGVLEGLVLSGAAPEATPLGSAWADVHVPFADGGTYASSLLTSERAAAAIALAPTTAFRGVKVAAPPTASLDDTIAVVAHALAAAGAGAPASA
ncbi:DUF4862 family protein [Agrococcus versicolor]|uniref:DUF4862 family protein n=1 Tax=Agrococcus versicolor TaxID=501482 RepID=A0ABP5MMZ9_9MICO